MKNKHTSKIGIVCVAVATSVLSVSGGEQPMTRPSTKVETPCGYNGKPNMGIETCSIETITGDMYCGWCFIWGCGCDCDEGWRESTTTTGICEFNSIGEVVCNDPVTETELLDGLYCYQLC